MNGTEPHNGPVAPAVEHHRLHHDMFDSGTTTPVGMDHGHGQCPDPGTVYAVGMPPAEALVGLSEESVSCLKNLAAVKPAPPME